MTKVIFGLMVVAALLGMKVVPVEAVTRINPSPTVTEMPLPKVTEKPVMVIREEGVGRFNGINGVRKAIELATDNGVPANTIVMLLLLPLIATLVSVLHYVFGLSGYGIFMPTMIAIAFLATGIVGGLVLFGVILAISLLSNYLLRRLKLHFWPSRSINLMFISLGAFGLMMVSVYLPILSIDRVSIFPMLFMILLAEEFVRTQLAKSRSEAKKLMVGTLVLAIVGAGAMSIGAVQEIVLRFPEVSLLLGLVVNILVGNYTGIRFSEIKRFGKAIRKSKKINK